MADINHEQLYFKGQYAACIEELECILRCLRNKSSKSTTGLILDELGTKLNSDLLELVIEGNLIVTEKMKLLMYPDEDEEYFDVSLRDYYQKLNSLYSSIKTYSCGTFAFSMFLNSLHNFLWWTWIKGFQGDEEKIEILDLLEESFTRVLFETGVQFNFSSDDIKLKRMFHLLFQVITYITKFQMTPCLQLIEIAELCMLIFSLPDNHIIGTKSLITALKDSWSAIKSKYLKEMKSDSESNVRSLKLFKFGFLKVNETTDFDIDKVHECLCLVSSLLLYRNGHVLESADMLTIHLSDTCTEFLCNYVQAYISHQLDKSDVTKYFLDKISCLHMSEYFQAHFHILRGQHDISTGHIVNAHLQFKKLLSSKKCYSAGLLHILNNLKRAVYAFYNDDANNHNRTCIEKYIQTLRCFYSFVCNMTLQGDNGSFRVEENLLSNLKIGGKYRKEDIFHFIGNEMLTIKVLNLSKDDHFSATEIASNCYLEILCIYFQQDSSLQVLFSNLWVVHEAIVALILTSKLIDAAFMCKILIPSCSVLDDNIVETICNTESFFMESGLAALMLSALINARQKKYTEAQQDLTRVKKAVVRIYCCLVNRISDKDTLILDALVAKVYLWKAALFTKCGYKMDAMQCCQKAITHHTCNEIIEECMKIADITANLFFTNERKMHPLKQCKSVTIQFLLTSNILS